MYGGYSSYVMAANVIIVYVQALTGQCIFSYCYIAMSYNPSDKPTVPQLCTGLSSVSDWQSFAIHLPGIETKHIHEIKSDQNGVKHQKMALFEKWLNVHPSATWSDVNGALVSIDEVSLATSLLNQSIYNSPMSLTLTPPSQQVSSPPPVQQQQQVVKRHPQAETHAELNIADEDRVLETLMELYDAFAQIIYKVKTDFISLVTQQPAQLQSIIRFAEDAVSPSQIVRFDASNIEEFFYRLRPYYDFLECRVITTIVKQFTKGEVVHDLQAHSAKAREFRRTAPIKQLAKGVCQIFTGVNGNLPTLDVKLETPWEDVVIDGLSVLIKHLLPNAVKKHAQYSLVNNIVIKPGCLLLQYGIRDPSMIDTIIQHIQSNIDLMTLIGVFQLAVDGRNVIQEDEDPSFSFNTALFEAIKASNIVAVQFLIVIGANVNYQMQTVAANEDGLTALMGAVMVNNIDIVCLLLKAGADINIKGKYGITALMLACGGGELLKQDAHKLSIDYRITARLLLSYGADPVAKVGDIGGGVLISSFDMACIADSSDMVEVLLTDCNIPPKAVGRGLYWALLYAAINTIKVLQPKIPDVDPLAIKLGVACGEGDTETVKSLIEQGVDPNTSIVHGLTPLMIASRCGHIDVVDTLLLQGVDVNKIDDIVDFTALDHAANIEHHDTMSLLKQHRALHNYNITSQNTSSTKSPFLKPFHKLKQFLLPHNRAKKPARYSLVHLPQTSISGQGSSYGSSSYGSSSYGSSGYGSSAQGSSGYGSSAQGSSGYDLSSKPSFSGHSNSDYDSGVGSTLGSMNTSLSIEGQSLARYGYSDYDMIKQSRSHKARPSTLNISDSTIPEVIIQIPTPPMYKEPNLVSLAGTDLFGSTPDVHVDQLSTSYVESGSLFSADLSSGSSHRPHPSGIMHSISTEPTLGSIAEIDEVMTFHPKKATSSHLPPPYKISLPKPNSSATLL